MPSSSLFSRRFRRVALSVGIVILFACGPDAFELNEFTSFFMPESSNATPPDRIYFFAPTTSLYSDETENGDSVARVLNQRAWSAYAGGSLPDSVVNNALYSPKEKSANSFIKRLRGKHPAAPAYLHLSWDAEKAAASGEVWNRVPADTARLTQLLADAQAGYRTATDGFLKERYGFQAVKLAGMIGDYATCKKEYEELIKPLSKKTFISDWARCRAAGATMALGDTTRAMYEFAQIFDQCPSRRREAELSLRVHHMRFREAALRYCRNDRERAAVYAISAIQPGQDALDFLRKIVELTPKNPLIELIMTREINRNEFFFFNNDNTFYAYTPDSAAFAKRKGETQSYFDKLKAFAQESAENKALDSPAFWYTTLSYLDYLAKDYKTAKIALDKAGDLPTNNPTLKQQIALQHMLLLAAQTETIAPETENQLIGYLEKFGKASDFRQRNAFVRVCQQFADKYGAGSAQKSGGWWASCTRSPSGSISNEELAKAYLLRVLAAYNRHELEDTLSLATAQKVVRFATTTAPTGFGGRLVQLTDYGKDDLYLLLGRRALTEQQYARAADAFANVSPKVWRSEPFATYFAEDPFAVHFVDKSTGPTQPNRYTPVTFARRMAQLEQGAAKATGDKAADLYYQLGCGAYNLSWHGNAWILIKAWWSGAEPAYGLYSYVPQRQQEQEKALSHVLQDPYYTTRPAKAFFERAILLAPRSELGAKACFMAGRCEENAFTTWREVEWRRTNYSVPEDQFNQKMKAVRRQQYSSFLHKLARQYGQTNFENEIVRECATYADYLAGK